MPIAAEAFTQPATNIPSNQRQPLLVAVHGSREFGGDHEAQVKKHGPWEAVRSLPSNSQYHEKTIAEMHQFHILGFHGIPAQGDWDGAELNDRLNAYLKATPEVDPSRVCITGFSRGGRGALRLALHRLKASPPEPVVGMAVFCPERESKGYSEADIRALRRVPIYFFHCPGDGVVSYPDTEVLQKAIGDDSSLLRAIEPNELASPNSPHVNWTNVYGHPDLYRWFLDPRGTPSRWPKLKPLPFTVVATPKAAP
jgi:predicted peptidase